MKFDSPLFDRIRVKPTADRRPKTGGPGCDWHGCKEKGSHRAPKGRDRENEYWRFCLEHVREYNKNWDYFAGLDAEQIEAHIRADTTWRRPVWPLGARRSNGNYTRILDPFDLADYAGLGERPAPRMDGSEQLTPAERDALGVLEFLRVNA